MAESRNIMNNCYIAKTKRNLRAKLTCGNVYDDDTATTQAERRSKSRKDAQGAHHDGGDKVAEILHFFICANNMCVRVSFPFFVKLACLCIHWIVCMLEICV